MATKTKRTPLKKTKKAPRRSVAPARPVSTDVSIKHVSNGFVISKWTNGREVAKIAKTRIEAKKIASEFMGL